MVKLLLDHCADVNIQESESYAEHSFGYGRTPLMSAVVACNTEIARLLLDNGADVSIKGRGLTALDFANTNKDKCPEMLVLLKEVNIKIVIAEVIAHLLWQQAVQQNLLFLLVVC
nr:ankyrin repeat domain-containing protein [Wolbachia endosymbiont (group B) of Camptogramma bilineatum]